MGVGLALIMVLSLAFALMPAKEAQAIEGEQQWLAQVGPSATYLKMADGTNVTEYAIASDGTTIYLIDGTKNLTGAAIYKSLDGGVTWVALPGPTAAAGATAQLVTNIAVAPDNPDAVAVSSGSNVSGTGIDQVWVSQNGGTTWSLLPAPLLQTGTTQMRIMDLKVAPARVGTLLPREYLIATSDNRAGNTTLGTLQIIGQGSAWTQVADATVPAGTYDYTSCEFSPGYAGDRVAVAVGSAANSVNLVTWNTQTPALSHAVVNLNTTIDDYDGAGAANQSILASDIALPIDYDVTVPGFERAFAGTASVGAAADNVWRCDATLPAQGLGLLGRAVRSLAYSGTTTAGTLFEGDYTATGGTLITQVNWTDQMTTNLPVWHPSRKPPTGTGGRAYVRTSPTFDADSKVFVGTAGAGAGNESALSQSVNAGDTYNQIAFIDNGAGTNTVVATEALALTPDGNTLFMVTRASGNINLWQTVAPSAPFTWQRIFCVTPTVAAGTVRLALNMGGWADAPEIYMADSANAASGLFASYDGGVIFTVKHLPAAGARFISVAGAKTLFLAITTNVYKSINGGQQWGPPINAGVGNIATVLPAPNGDILVGGAGNAAISKDGGASFSLLQPGLAPAATAVGVMADAGYADNNIVYAFDFQNATGVYRVNVATGGIWENLTAAPAVAANIFGFGQSNGVLYAMRLAAADRTFDSRNTVGTITWGNLAAGGPPAAAAGCFSIAENRLYVSNGTTGIWAYVDQMATASATITAPAAGSVVPVDPVSGRSMPVPLSWTPMGSGQGLCTSYTVFIYDTAAGAPAGTAAAVAIGPPFRTAPKTTINVPGAAAFPGTFVLLGGHEYTVMVRAAIQLSGDTLLSSWSAPVTFQVEASGGIIQPPHAGPILTSPTPGDQNVKPDCAFSWAPMSGVTSYELIISTKADMSAPVAGTPVTLNTTAFGPVDLEYNTDYYYAVRATAPTSSVQSIGAFRTMVSPEEAAPPVVVEQPTVSPAWIWAVVIIGALLVIAVLVLIVRTRRA
jgi:hypothetical protein